MNFSVVICTYNPTKALLERVVERVTSQSHQPFEILVVDNNSRFEVAELPFISLNSRIKCIREPRQGLAYARVTAAKTINGEWAVFLDDDNIASRDYLEKLALLTANNPQVGAWGPGKVHLEYEVDPPAWLSRDFAHMYQQREHNMQKTGREEGWPWYYPSGSGMAVSAAVLRQYASDFDKGLLSATGRKGGQLTSAEDSQLVWTAVKMGLEAGTSPVLCLTHVISGFRTNMQYLLTLQRSLGRSYHTAFSEMFPDKTEAVAPLSLPGKMKMAVNTLVKSRFNPIRFARMIRMELAWFGGVSESAQEAKQKRK